MPRLCRPRPEELTVTTKFYAYYNQQSRGCDYTLGCGEVYYFA